MSFLAFARRWRSPLDADDECPRPRPRLSLAPRTPQHLRNVAGGFVARAAGNEETHAVEVIGARTGVVRVFARNAGFCFNFAGGMPCWIEKAG